MKQRKESDVLVSICIVVKNGASTIAATLRSVSEIKTEETEVIVVDGCSTDGTIDIINSFANVVTVFQSAPDGGIYDAMNKAWKVAVGDFIYFLGADDRLLYLPLTELKSLRGGSAAGLCGRVNIGKIDVHRPSFGFTLRFLNTLHHQGLFLKRNECLETPFDLRFKRFADFDLNQRLQVAGRKIVVIESVISEFNPGGFSSSGASALPEIKSIIKKNWGSKYCVAASILMRLIGIRARTRSMCRRLMCTLKP